MAVETPRAVRRRALPMLAAALGLLFLGLAVLVGVAIGGVGVGWLVSSVDEGSVPSSSWFPDVPAEAEVISQEQACGSGGCWWELRLAPSDGQSPSDLAATMGVDDPQSFPGTFPLSRDVYLSSDVIDDELRVYLGYEQLLP